MKVHCLTHVSYEGPGYILQWLEEKEHSITFTRFYEDAALPDVSSIDAVVVMGGPMGTSDEENFPWLRKEKEFLYRCIAAGKRILGICLGAQLIAEVLGADIHTAPYKEIGWFPVYPAENALQTTWFTQLFEQKPMLFHWHGDQFMLPQKSPDLLKTDALSHQAFLCGNGIIGLQFHAEVTEYSLNDMLENGKNELSENGKYIQNADFIRCNSHFIPSCNRLMSQILEKWLG